MSSVVVVSRVSLSCGESIHSGTKLHVFRFSAVLIAGLPDCRITVKQGGCSFVVVLGRGHCRVRQSEVRAWVSHLRSKGVAHGRSTSRTKKCFVSRRLSARQRNTPWNTDTNRQSIPFGYLYFGRMLDSSMTLRLSSVSQSPNDDENSEAPLRPFLGGSALLLC